MPLRTYALAFAVLAIQLWPADALPCTYARRPARSVQPAAGAVDVPLNANIYLSATDAHFDDTAEFALVRLAGGTAVQVPFTLERLPYASALEGRVRLTPSAQLEPNATYAVCHWLGAEAYGAPICPEEGLVLTFTTGTQAAGAVPPGASALRLEVAREDLPDAGPNLFCSAPRRVRAITAHVPDAGADVLYFARVGDAGVFSAELGASLSAGIPYPDVTAAGILDCDGSGYVPLSHHWGVPAGTTALEVWTEDGAGNASTPVTVSLHGDCIAGTPDGDTGPTSSNGSPSRGCAGAPGGAAAVGVLAWALLAHARRRRRMTRQ
jgi:hypothetical protein